MTNTAFLMPPQVLEGCPQFDLSPLSFWCWGRAAPLLCLPPPSRAKQLRFPFVFLFFPRDFIPREEDCHELFR